MRVFLKKSAVWLDASAHAKLLSIKSHADNTAYTGTTEHYLESVESRYRTRYTLDNSGALDVTVWFLAAPHRFQAALPRIGHRFQLHANYNAAEWFGRGPFENYWDRKLSAFFGQYKMPIKELGHDYVRPQENGQRSDVFSVSFSTNKVKSPAITFTGAPTIGFNAEYRDILDYDTLHKTGSHTHDIALKDNAYVNIDFKQRGVAGTDS